MDAASMQHSTFLLLTALPVVVAPDACPIAIAAAVVLLLIALAVAPIFPQGVYLAAIALVAAIGVCMYEEAFPSRRADQRRDRRLAVVEELDGRYLAEDRAYAKVQRTYLATRSALIWAKKKAPSSPLITIAEGVFNKETSFPIERSAQIARALVDQQVRTQASAYQCTGQANMRRGNVLCIEGCSLSEIYEMDGLPSVQFEDYVVEGVVDSMQRVLVVIPSQLRSKVYRASVRECSNAGGVVDLRRTRTMIKGRGLAENGTIETIETIECHPWEHDVLDQLRDNVVMATNIVGHDVEVPAQSVQCQDGIYALEQVVGYEDAMTSTKTLSTPRIVYAMRTTRPSSITWWGWTLGGLQLVSFICLVALCRRRERRTMRKHRYAQPLLHS